MLAMLPQRKHSKVGFLKKGLSEDYFEIRIKACGVVQICITENASQNAQV
jgi:hypothetical protein